MVGPIYQISQHNGLVVNAAVAVVIAFVMLPFGIVVAVIGPVTTPAKFWVSGGPVGPIIPVGPVIPVTPVCPVFPVGPVIDAPVGPYFQCFQ